MVTTLMLPTSQTLPLGEAIPALGTAVTILGCATRSFFCPNKDRPGIREIAVKNYKEWLVNYKVHHK